MFEAVEVGNAIAREDYQAQAEELRLALLSRQYEVRNEAAYSVLVVLAGDDWPGRNAVLSRLTEWMDARYIEVNAFGQDSDEERERPFFWRYWRTLPAKGRMGVYFGDWTMQTIVGAATGGLDEAALERRLAHLVSFERALAENGTRLVKLWLHLPRAELKRRLKSAGKNPQHGWFFRPQDHVLLKRYRKLRELAERVLRTTNTAEAPWRLVESTDPCYRDLTCGRILLAGLNGASPAAPPATPRASPSPPVIADPHTILDTLRQDESPAEKDYEARLSKLQARLNKLSRKAHDSGLSTVLAFEGWDAAGKGGAIRRVTAALDATNYRIVAVAAPSDEERARHWLWRFWRHLPRAGRMVIFDRSWYGRVLVERVERLTPEADWRRGYQEINDFERQLHEHGMVLVKFWLHISADEQFRRFQQRETVPFKKYKITAEDYRNRERWFDYETAANDMVAQTSTEFAPWTLVPANDKRGARLRVLKTICDSLAHALRRKPKAQS